MKYDKKKLAKLQEQVEQKRAALRDLSSRRNESLNLWRRRESAWKEEQSRIKGKPYQVPDSWRESWRLQEQRQKREVFAAKNEYEQLAKEVEALELVVKDLGALVDRLRSYVGNVEEDEQVAMAS